MSLGVWYAALGFGVGFYLGVRVSVGVVEFCFEVLLKFYLVFLSCGLVRTVVVGAGGLEGV